MNRFSLSAVVFLAFLSPTFGGEPKPFPGKVTKWNGFDRYDFQVDGVNVTVVAPEKAAAGKPWLWRGEFFGHAAEADVGLVKKGWHLGFVNAQNLYGSPKAMALWEKFYATMVKDYGMSPKPGFCGMSRGGLHAMAWGANHPDKTLAIWLDNAVCDAKSWPGGKVKKLGSGDGSGGDWNRMMQAYGFKSDEEAIAYKGFPVDRLEPLAKAKVPLLLVYGNKDNIVPHTENSEIVFVRYGKLGGPVERIVKDGKGHHPHGLPDATPIVEFFEKSWSARK